MTSMNAIATAASVEDALHEAYSRFSARNPRSRAYFERASSFPGGSTRSVLFYEPFPVTIESSKGALLVDADGHEYVDLLNEFSAAFYGHTNMDVRAAILEATNKGLSFGGPNTYEAEFAHFLTDTFPTIEKIRFCNSGTEANLYAIQLAEQHSSKKGLLAFEGAYHGGLLSFANGPMPLNIKTGVVLSEFNDLDALRRVFKTHSDRLGVCIVEPFMAAGGAIAADPDFLHELRRLCTLHGVVLIFDEVVSSRLAVGGLQQSLGVSADLTTLGKYIGGGLSFGAFGGDHHLMDRLDMRQPHAIPHAGTFNNNVLSMVCGLAASRYLTHDNIERVNALGDRLRAGIEKLASESRLSLSATGVGSLSCIHFQRTPIHKPSDIQEGQSLLRDLFHLFMLEHGFYLARRGSVYLSIDTTPDNIAAFLDATRRFADQYCDFLTNG